jgi:hypothetical protein
MLDRCGGISLSYNNLRELCAYLRAKLPMLLTDRILVARFNQFELTLIL